MFGQIVYISNSGAKIKISGAVNTSLMNMHVVLEDNGRRIIASVENVNE